MEYAIIVERKAEYFSKLAMESYFKIGNIGETPMKTFSFDENGRSPFTTSENMNGFKIDGITERAGNIPTGNGKEGCQSLILTVEELMELYKNSAEAPFGGELADKSDMLSSTVVIYTNAGHTSDLHEKFRVAREAYECTEAKHHSGVSKKRLQFFANDIKYYTFVPEFVRYQPPKNQDVQIKTDIFRYPTLLANNIKLCMGLSYSFSWDTYSALYSKRILSAETHQYLRIILALSIYIRTSAYLARDSQVETVSFSLESTKSAYQMPHHLFMILSCLLIPIKQTVSSFVENFEQIDEENANSCQSVTQMLQSIHVGAIDFLIKAEICYFCGRYTAAKEELRKAIGQPIELVSCEEFIRFHDLYNKPVHKYVELCCYLLYNTQMYIFAVDYFDWLINSHEGDVILWKLLTAHCKRELGDYRAADQLLKEV